MEIRNSAISSTTGSGIKPAPAMKIINSTIHTRNLGCCDVPTPNGTVVVCPCPHRSQPIFELAALGISGATEGPAHKCPDGTEPDNSGPFPSCKKKG